MLVIDSGSRDRSLEIARAAGVELLEIDPASSATAAPATSAPSARRRADLLPHPGRDPVPGLAGCLPRGLRARRARRRRLRPAPAATQTQPDDRPRADRVLRRLHRPGERVNRRDLLQPACGDPTFLSNVNACYARDCWEEIRFRDIAYSEDQAFGADLLEAGWIKVYHPRQPSCTPTTTARSSSCAATSTSTAACVRAPATSSPSGIAAARECVPLRRRSALDGRAGPQRPGGRPRDRAGSPSSRRPPCVLGAGFARRAVPGPVSSQLSLEGRSESSQPPRRTDSATAERPARAAEAHRPDAPTRRLRAS